VQEKENSLWNNQSDQMEGQHYDLVKKQELPTQIPSAREACMVLTYMYYFGV